MKNRIEEKSRQRVVDCSLALVKSRVLIDLQFYKTMDDRSTFEMLWSDQVALCTVFEVNLLLSLCFCTMYCYLINCKVFVQNKKMLSLSLSLYVHISLTHAHTHTHTHTHTRTQAHTLTCTHTHTSAHTHMHTHAHKRTHSHARTHTDTQVLIWPLCCLIQRNCY